MPKVPSVNERSVLTQPLPNPRSTVRATPETFGAGVGRSIQQAAQTSNEIYLREKNKADQIAVMAADKQLSDYELQTLYDPDNGALTKRGRDALGIPDQVADGYGQLVSEIEKTLSNDEQRIAFGRLAESRRVSMDKAVQRHVSNELEAYDNETTLSYIENSRDAAIVNYNDPQRIRDEINRQKVTYLLHQQRTGKSQEWLTQKTSEAVSKTHIGVINRMIANGQDRQADQYFKDNKGEISDGDDIASVENALEESSLRGESQRIADRITRNITERAGALEAVKLIEDPKVRDEVNRRVNNHFNQLKQSETEHRENLYTTSASILERNGGDIRAINPKAWVDMTPSQRTALENRARQIREGIEPVQRDRIWLEFSDLTAKELASMSGAELHARYRPYLDNTHFDRAVNLWSQVRDTAKQRKSPDPKLTSSLTFKDRVKSHLRQVNAIDAQKTLTQLSEDEARLYIQFESEAASRLEQFELSQLQGKRTATGEEIQKVLDGITLEKVFVNDSWVPFADSEKRIIMLTDEDKQNEIYVPFDDIPRSEINTIENKIKSRGKMVTEDKVQRAYAAYLIDDRNLFNSIINE